MGTNFMTLGMTGHSSWGLERGEVTEKQNSLGPLAASEHLPAETTIRVSPLEVAYKLVL